MYQNVLKWSVSLYKTVIKCKLTDECDNHNFDVIDGISVLV